MKLRRYRAFNADEGEKLVDAFEVYPEKGRGHFIVFISTWKHIKSKKLHYFVKVFSVVKDDSDVENSKRAAFARSDELVRKILFVRRKKQSIKDVIEKLVAQL